jgi:hypothetical protein
MLNQVPKCQIEYGNIFLDRKIPMEKISIVDSAPPWLTVVKQDAHFR